MGRGRFGFGISLPCRAVASSLLLLGALACGDDDSIADSGPLDGSVDVGGDVAADVMGDAPLDVSLDVGPELAPASMDIRLAFEGHQRHINSFTVPGVSSFEGATIRPTPGAPFEVVRSECSGARCAVELRILDTLPNRGIGIPSPIDAVNTRLEIITSEGVHRGLLSVQPLDAVVSTPGEPSRLSEAIRMSASIEHPSGATFISGSDEPVRWVVFGDLNLQGALDFSGGISGLAGGGAGGEPGAAAADDLGGEASAGGAGTSSDGGDGPSGSGGVSPATTPGLCTGDFDQPSCGGGGGGGGDGEPGGAGGGSFLLVALSNSDLSGAEIRVRGESSGSGGGGGGGEVVVAGAQLAADQVDALGGDSETGGSGGEGRVRVDHPESVTPTRFYVELDDIELITSEDAVVFQGVAPVGWRVQALEEGTQRASQDAVPASGRFEIRVPLREGVNRIEFAATNGDERLLCWTGTNVRLARESGASRPRPVAATIDIARLP